MVGGECHHELAQVVKDLHVRTYGMHLNLKQQTSRRYGEERDSGKQSPCFH